MRGFFAFIREHGIAGFAFGFILGSAVSKLVTAFVNDLINPVLGLALGFAKGLEKAYFQVGSAKILWGHFISVSIDFLVVSLVVYVMFRILKLKKLDLKK